MPYNRITVVYPYFDRNRTVSILTLTVYGTVYDGHRPYWTVNCTVVTVYGTVTIPNRDVDPKFPSPFCYILGQSLFDSCIMPLRIGYGQICKSKNPDIWDANGKI